MSTEKPLPDFEKPEHVNPIETTIGGDSSSPTTPSTSNASVIQAKQEAWQTEQTQGLAGIRQQLANLSTNISSTGGSTMSQAVVNPQEVRKFAGQLKSFNEQLKGMMAALNGQFNQLGETWRDQQHARFAQEFQELNKALQRFNQSSEQQIPVLIRKAEMAEQYLNSR